MTVVEDGPITTPGDGRHGVDVVLPWVLSARTPDGLAVRARDLRGFLRDSPGADPVDVAAGLAGFPEFEHRAVVLGTDRSELDAGLETLAAGGRGVPTGRAGGGRTVFAFPGQGTQRIGMAARLHASSAPFAAAFDAAADACDAHLPRGLRDVLWGGDQAALDRTGFAQPALFAVEVGLAALLESFGVVPDLVLGHSLGEITAAHVAGALDLADAAKLVTTRARLMEALPDGGAMVAVWSPADVVTPLLTDGVDLAAVNAPEAVVVSGVEARVLAVADELSGRGYRTTRLAVSHAFHSGLMAPIERELADVVGTLSVRTPRIPVVSNVDGRVTTDGYATGDYWVRHVRSPVRFADSVDAVLADDPGARFVEVGPGSALTGLLRAVARSAQPVLRRDVDELRSLTGALAALHVDGVAVDWTPVIGERAEPGLALPAYPLADERFRPELASPVDAAEAFGLRPSSHPILTAVLPDPVAGGLTLAGRLALDDHPWLADHAIADTVLVPGAAFVDWALAAASEAGLGAVGDVVLSEPLVLPESGTVHVQVVVGPADAGGRPVSVYSRPRGADGGWTRHAEGVLIAAPRPEGRAEDAWPPPGAEPVDVEAVRRSAAELGYRHGPAFQGLTAAWRTGDAVVGDVVLPPGAGDREAFALHPALLDAALQAAAHLGVDAEPGRVLLPFAWEQVVVHSPGAGRARVRVTRRSEHQVSITLTDPAGGPVAEVGAVSLRPLDPGRLGSAAVPLFHIGWIPHPVPGDGPPHTALVGDGRWDGDPKALHGRLHEIAEQVRDLLHTSADPIVVCTRGAVRVRGGDRVDPAASAVWGLLRSAQTENPGRIVLVDADTDVHTAAAGDLGRFAAAGEDQLAVRGGETFAARLTATGPPSAPAARVDLSGGTVLITGGTGQVGAAVARHLVAEHGATRLLLLSRSGAAPGTPPAPGVEVESVACDVANRDALARVLDAVPDTAPLRAVVHAAGVLDDATFDGLTRAQLEVTLRAKTNGAWNLHELTRHRDVSLFLLCSSFAATVGAPGQANYSAANAFLDGLAELRQVDGLPAHSVAWGLWEPAAGMSGELDAAVLARLAARGILAMTEQSALERMAAVLASGRAHAVAAELDTALLAAAGARPGAPTVLRGLPAGPRPGGTVRTTATSATTGTSPAAPASRAPATAPADDVDLLTELAGLGPRERTARVREVVFVEMAAALGHGDVAAIDPQARFTELGFESLSAVEFRNGLTAVIGMRMPVTLAFDFETPATLIDFLVARIGAQIDDAEEARP